MTLSKRSEARNQKQLNDLNDLAKFVQPIHFSIISDAHPDSLEYIGESEQIRELSLNYQRFNFKEEKEELDYLYNKFFKAEGNEKQIIERLIDAKLEQIKANKFDSLQLLDLKLKRSIDGKAYKDKFLFKMLADELKTIGLPRLSQAVEALSKKTGLVTSIKDVFVSKRAKSGAKNRNVNINQSSVKEYEEELKTWANQMMVIDIDSRKSKNLAPRPKRYNGDHKNKSFKSADIREEDYDDLPMNILLLSMAETDKDYMSLPKDVMLDEAFMNELTPDMNRYGTPELPDGLEKYQYSASFFYKCIKNHQ
ncbi:MAG: hypothetical protein ACSHW0_14880 [Thalassotalea sp.]